MYTSKDYFYSNTSLTRHLYTLELFIYITPIIEPQFYVLLERLKFIEYNNIFGKDVIKTKNITITKFRCIVYSLWFIFKNNLDN